jgi:predicted DNA binding protein
MWIARLRIKHKDCIFSPLVKRFKLTDLIYPLNQYSQEGRDYFVSSHTVQGKLKDVKRYAKALRKNDKVKRLDIKGNFMVVLVEEKTSPEYKEFYDPLLLYPKPVMNAADGLEYWELASWHRRVLSNVIKKALQKYEGKLIYMNKSKLENIFIPQMMPKLTEKQKYAFELALSRGYYTYPRKTNLSKLAKIMDVSRPTFDIHLRRAEQRLMPFFRKFY